MSELLDTVKTAAVDAWESGQPVELRFGKVLSANPLKVKISDTITLTKEFIALVGEVKTGDEVSVLRKQGGQQYLVLGDRTDRITGTVYSYIGGDEDTIYTGKTYKAMFTGYYPDGSAMEGQPVDMLGKPLVPSKNAYKTCAANRGFKYGQKVQFSGTGISKIDGKVYTINDTGSSALQYFPPIQTALSKLGYLHFDILCSSLHEANSVIGKRWGKVLVITGKKTVSTGDSTAGLTNKRTALYSLVRSKLGCRYVYGATGSKTFDCSGLMYWCYKQIGVTIPRTAAAQYRGSRRISGSQAKVGDLVFFSGTTGASGITHVGMYIGNGYMIHAANPSRGVVKENLNTRYYGNHLAGYGRFLKD